MLEEMRSGLAEASGLTSSVMIGLMQLNRIED